MNVFADVCGMWKQTYRDSKFLFWMGALGVFCSVMASVIFNLTITDPAVWPVLILYTIGSITLSITSFKMRDSWMLLLMTWYTLINTVGITKLIIG